MTDSHLKRRGPLAKVRAYLLLGALHGLAACGGGDDGGAIPTRPAPAPVATVLLGEFPAPSAGDFIQLSLEVRDASGNAVRNPAIEWTSSDSGVAKITQRGLLLALGPGSVDISARVESVVARRNVIVTQREILAGQLAVLLGPEEIVYDWDTERCFDGHAPDTPAHAVRLTDGSILLTASNDPENYLWTGRDFDSLKPICPPSLISLDDPTAASYRNREWIAAAYRIGNTIHALITNEYHDPIASRCKPGDSSPGNPCWSNSITYAASTDNGKNFRVPSPHHIVAPAPRPWDPQNNAARSEPHGYLAPSNILRFDDAFYYSTFHAIPDPNEPSRRGLCVMRTTNLADAASWRAWDGTGYTLPLADPHMTGGGAVAACRIVNTPLSGSITYNRYLGRYMLMDRVADQSGCSFALSTSNNLLRWTAPLPFKAAKIQIFHDRSPCPPTNGNQGATAYPSLIDHDSSSTNFEDAGQSAWVYYTRFTNSNSDNPRNLIRQAVIFLKSPSFAGDVSPPSAALDLPLENASVSGIAEIAGWAYDEFGMNRVEILVDGALVGSATLGISRPDLPEERPDAPPDAGWRLFLDTRQLSNGQKTLQVRPVDNNSYSVTIKRTFAVANS